MAKIIKMFYIPRDPAEKKNKFYDDMYTSVAVAMCNHAFEKSYGKSKFGYVVDGLQFMNNPSVDTALGIGISNLISHGIKRPVTGLVLDICLGAGIPKTPRGLIAAAVVGFISYLISEATVGGLHSLFESGSGPFIYVDSYEKLGALSIKKPDDWDDDEGGEPGGIEFHVFVTIKEFSSDENVLS